MERLWAACQHGTTAEILDLLTSESINPRYRDQDGNTLMFYACQRDLPLVVEALCQRDFQLEQVTKGGKSALHVAAYSGSRNVVDLLASRFPALLNVRCSLGFTAIHSAVERGLQDMFHRLLAVNMNPRAVCFSKRNILHLACERGHYDMFIHLVTDYSDVLHMKAFRDWGIIHFAAVGGNIQIMDHLINDGFNILQTTSDDTTPLHFACSKGRVEMVKFLLSKLPNQLHLCDSQGYQAIHHAASGGSMEVIHILQKGGAEVEKKTKEGLTVLHIASFGKNTELVKYLVDNFPNLLEMKDGKGRSVLFTAAEGGSVAIMEFLIGRGMDPYVLSISGSTILHLACAKANTAMVEYLISKYQDLITMIDERGCAPIHSATEGGDTEIFDRLVSAGALPNEEFSNGFSILLIACGEGRKPAMVKHIVQKFQAMINKSEQTLGCYPCHYVAKFHSLELFKLLEENGADMFKTTSQGNTILHLACETANINIVEYIISHYPRLVHHRNKAGALALDFALASKNTQLVHLIHTKSAQILKRQIYLSNIMVIIIIVAAFAWNLYHL